MTHEEAAELSDDIGADWSQLADSGGAFEFWLDPEEDVYSEKDGDPL